MQEGTNKIIDTLVSGAKNIGKEIGDTSKQVVEDVKEIINPRQFEHVKRLYEEYPMFEYLPFKLPERSTGYSAGYDFFNPVAQVCAPKSLTLIKTGVKAKMPKDNYLELYNRSSNPKKKGLFLANGCGVVDADYYSNEDNDGEIGFMFYNYTDQEVIFEVGEKIGQGIFKRYDLVQGDEYGKGDTRKGGFGSTGN